jgi:phosphatidylglycerophosphatase A
VVAWLVLTFSSPDAAGILLWLLTGLAAMIGTWAVQAILNAPGRRSSDPPQVVIDEVLGVWLALACCPAMVTVASPGTTVIVAVLMFRVLDIAKPFPIAAAERLPGAVGVMADDALAGVLAGLATTALLG